MNLVLVDILLTTSLQSLKKVMQKVMMTDKNVALDNSILQTTVVSISHGFTYINLLNV